MDETFQVRDIRKQHWYHTDNIFVDVFAKVIGIYAVGVYNCLCRFSNEDGESWPSHQTMADLLSVSKRTVQDGVNTLVLHQMVRRIKKAGNKNKYYLIDRDDWVLRPTSEENMKQLGHDMPHLKTGDKSQLGQDVPHSENKNYPQPEHDMLHLESQLGHHMPQGRAPHALHQGTTCTSYIRRRLSYKSLSKKTVERELSKEGLEKAFEAFWSAYPVKGQIRKTDALNLYSKIVLNLDDVDLCLKALELYRVSNIANKRDYVMYAVNFLKDIDSWIEQLDKQDVADEVTVNNEKWIEEQYKKYSEELKEDYSAESIMNCLKLNPLEIMARKNLRCYLISKIQDGALRFDAAVRLLNEKKMEVAQ